MDETPTPRFTPFLASAPVNRVLALDWATRLASEAAAARGLQLWNRAEKCDDCARRMRALALDFERIAQVDPTKPETKRFDPGPEGRRKIDALWKDAQAEARKLRIPPGEYGS